MTDETTKHGNNGGEGPFGHGNYEHQDLGPKNILYFLLVLGVATSLCMVGLRGLYTFLDHRVRASQPEVNPLITNVPQDTLHIPPGYPQTAFPSPRLEEDERGQLNDIRLQQDNTLYSYGWVDENAGTVRIPIERAMDLLVQRGLPVRPQETGDKGAEDEGTSGSSPATKATGPRKGEMK